MSHRKPIGDIVVLDLDETLIYASEERLNKKTLKEHVFRSYDETYYIYERPYLATFMRYIANRYQIAVWTAATHDYASFIVNNILYQYIPRRNGLQFFYTREQSNFSDRHTGVLKNLDYLERRGLRVILIDDNPDVREQSAFVITVDPFEGQTKDDVLKQIVENVL